MHISRRALDYRQIVLIAPPDIPASHIAVFDAETKTWSLHEEHRDETVDTQTGNPIYISEPSPLPENVTSVSPGGEYQTSGKIAPLQDAVDLGIATDDEKAQLDEWKKYRVLVNRMDTSAPDWPEVPISH